MLIGTAGQVLIMMVLAAILTAAEVYRAEILVMLDINRAWHDQCEGRAGMVEGRQGGEVASTPPQAAGIAGKRGKKRRTRPQSRA